MSRDLLQVGRALAAPARVAMVTMLFDGAEHTAGELARSARVAAATASEHLATLTEAGIVSGRSHGRHRYYQLADADIAHALEQLSQGDPEPKVNSLRLSREQQRVRAARTCYDHLAGQLGVGIAARFVELGWIDPSVSVLTDAGSRGLLAHFGIDQVRRPGSTRPLMRSCLDWTERRPHIAGAVGAAMAAAFLDRRLVVRRPGSRGLTVTEKGRVLLAELGIGAVVG